MGHFAISIICKNGHLVTARSESGDVSKYAYCRKCGAETVSSCQQCHVPIRGRYIHSDALDFRPYTFVPSYCEICGSPYPWIERLLLKVKKLISLETSLTEQEKFNLAEASVNITIESATSTIDASIFKKLLQKTTGVLRDSLYQFAVDVASETAKKALFPDS